MPFYLLPEETVMPDNSPVYDMYVYICDGVFTRYLGGWPTTIRAWKLQSGYKEIRRCNLFGHKNARLGDRVVAIEDLSKEEA